jgi:N-carbamoyl-L-amino-acid hydrolase
MIADVEARRDVRFALGARAQAPVAVMSPDIVNSLVRAATALDIPARLLGSPASHDAAAFADAHVPVGMIFVRNEHGSHNPLEHMTIEDFLAATAVLTSWLVSELTPGC